MEGAARWFKGRALGIEMIIPDWFYEGVIDQALVLTIDPDYFALTGGLERWLYRSGAQAWRQAEAVAGASTSSICI
jgi:plasmid replication initiation protein